MTEPLRCPRCLESAAELIDLEPVGKSGTACRWCAYEMGLVASPYTTGGGEEGQG